MVKSDRVVFRSTVRLQKGLLETGKISSLKLMPFVGREVEVCIKPAEAKK